MEALYETQLSGVQLRIWRGLFEDYSYLPKKAQRNIKMIHGIMQAYSIIDRILRYLFFPHIPSIFLSPECLSNQCHQLLLLSNDSPVLNQQQKMKGKHHENKSDDSDDDQSEASNEINTDNSPKYIPIAKLSDKPKTKKIVINISDTQYPIVEEIAEELGWIVQKNQGPGDWDVWWTDREIEPNTLFRMNLHQKINHFPGIYILARKNLFGLGLMSMREHFPQEYNFFPETWTIPLQFSQFRHYYQSVEKGKTRTYIVKPEALSQGRGIFLTRNIQDILNGNKYVIQRYIKNPLLIDKLKFDFRIYILLAGTDPLRLYIYHEGLTRFATEEYQEPTAENMARSYIHLTNYSLNKSNPNYVFNKSDKDMDKGHKRTLSSTYQRLAKQGVDVQALKLSIQDAIIKSVISGLPSIRHQYQYCQPQQYEGGMCFHILGFDVMLTDDFKPIVIQVNHTPSFETGTPLDYLVKKNLIKDTLKLMRITQKNKRKNFERARQLAKIRLETGKREIFKGKERDEIIKKARAERDQFEKDIMGGYKRIFPPYDQAMEQKYNKFYQIAAQIYRDDNETRKKILNEQKKKAEPAQPKKKIDKPNKTDAQFRTQKLIETQAKAKKQLKQAEEYQTLQNIPADSSMDRIMGKMLNLQQEMIRQQMRDSKTHSQYQEQALQLHKRTNFRMKVSRKNQPNTSSNNQLVKYTESIKKFNDLMVKFIQKEELQGEVPSDMDLETFQKLKEKLGANRQTKCLSQNAPIPLFAPFGIRDLKPVIGASLSKPSSNIKELRLQVRNGSFLKPKNYLISDEKAQSQARKEKRFSDESLPRDILTGEHLIGGIIVENKSSKAYSKLLKNPGGRALAVPFRL